MRLVYTKYNIDIVLNENMIPVFTIESPQAFREMFGDLWKQVNGLEGKWIVSEKEKEIKLSKEFEIITNPFALDINDKKIILRLYQEIMSVSEDFLAESIGKLNSEIICLIDQMCESLPYPIVYNDSFPVDGLLKLAEVKLESDDRDSIQYLADYICLKKKICNITTFVFLNPRQFYDDGQIAMLYKKLQYEKINFIVFESTFLTKIELEKRWILDRDLCIIEA